MKRFKGTKDGWYVVNYAGTYVVQDRSMYDDANILDSDDVGESKAYYNAKLASCAPLLLDALIKSRQLIKSSTEYEVGIHAYIDGIEQIDSIINKSIEP